MISDQEKKQWAKFWEAGPDERKNEDPTFYRIGVQKSAEVVKTMVETSIKAKKVISHTQVEHKTLLKLAMLREIMDELRGAVMIAYPGWNGLGEWEPALLIINKKYDFFDRSTNTIDFLDPKDATLWCAGKEYFKGKTLSNYIGKNEKSKIIVKLTKGGAGAPTREPAIDKKTEMDLMSYYHKKEETYKKLKEDNDDNYMGAVWADSTALKKNLVGGGQGIRFK